MDMLYSSGYVFLQRRLIEMKTIRKKILLTLVLALCIACVLPGVSASAAYVGTFTKDTDAIYIEFYQSSIPIQGVVLQSGGLPAGVEMYWEDTKAYITGVPQSAGAFTATFAVVTSEGMLPVELQLAVTDEAQATQAPVARTGEIVITKHPTGERVEAGGMAKFVAKAENANRIVWRLVSPDASDTVRCSAAGDYFPGLEVSGLGTDTLVLNRIPRDLNGWYVEAQFWIDEAVHVESSGAKITIVDAEGNPVGSGNTQAPNVTASPSPVLSTSDVSGGMDLPIDEGARTANIVIQPQNWELKPGESCTLSVKATSPNNGVLSYQWYSAATDNRNAALPISGASDASYTVNQADGTAYYWVAVWNSRDGSRSQAVYSDPAEVRIVTPATPTPEPVVTPMPEPDPTPARQSIGPNIPRLIPFLIVGVLALAALIGVVIYMRADARREDEYEYEDDVDYRGRK